MLLPTWTRGGYFKRTATRSVRPLASMTDRRKKPRRPAGSVASRRAGSEASERVGQVAVVGGQPSFSAKDPNAAYGRLVDRLIAAVSQDLYPTYERHYQ